MPNDVIHRPEQPHRCQVGCETYELPEGDPLREQGYVGVNPFAHSFDPIGTIRQCECGRTFVAKDVQRPGRRALYVTWVPEGRIARWLRQRRERKQRERWVPPTQNLPPAPLPPPEPTP